MHAKKYGADRSGTTEEKLIGPPPEVDGSKNLRVPNITSDCYNLGISWYEYLTWILAVTNIKEDVERRVLFLSRSAGNGPEDPDTIKEPESVGCEIRLVKGSVLQQEDVTRALEQAPNLKGIIQCSMVLRDENFGRMTSGELRWLLRSKGHGISTTLHLPLGSNETSLSCSHPCLELLDKPVRQTTPERTLSLIPLCSTEQAWVSQRLPWTLEQCRMLVTFRKTMPF